MESRKFVVGELLKNIKNLITQTSKAHMTKTDSHTYMVVHKEVLMVKYYLLKAKLRISENKYEKALKNLLYCLNYPPND